LQSSIEGADPGDVIISINRTPITNYSDLYNMLHTTLDQYINATLLRGKDLISLSIWNKKCKIFGDGGLIKKLGTLLHSNRPVNLHIGTPRQIKLGNDRSLKEQDLETLSELLQENLINYYSKFTTVFPNFRIVQRKSLTPLLSEIELDQKGLISKESSFKIGKMTGANYYMQIIVVTSYLSYGIDISTIKKVIDLEKGEIIASDKTGMFVPTKSISSFP